MIAVINCATMVLYASLVWKQSSYLPILLLCVGPALVILSFVIIRVKALESWCLRLLKLLVLVVMIVAILFDFKSCDNPSTSGKPELLVQKGFFFGVNFYVQQLLLMNWYSQSIIFGAAS